MSIRFTPDSSFEVAGYFTLPTARIIKALPSFDFEDAAIEHASGRGKYVTVDFTVEVELPLDEIVDPSELALSGFRITDFESVDDVVYDFDGLTVHVTVQAEAD